jgi:hypothetical protein
VKVHQLNCGSGSMRMREDEMSHVTSKDGTRIAYMTASSHPK